MEAQKKIRYLALDRCVIAVAVEGEVQDWAAYIGAVLGNRHRDEWQRVAERGSKLSKEVAEILFPDFKHLKWRY